MTTSHPNSVIVPSYFRRREDLRAAGYDEGPGERCLQLPDRGEGATVVKMKKLWNWR